jgi:two-component system, sensor histidine kinase PdtaS
MCSKLSEKKILLLLFMFMWGFFLNAQKLNEEIYLKNIKSPKLYKNEIKRIHNLISSNLSEAKKEVNILINLTLKHQHSSAYIDGLILQLALFQTSGNETQLKMELLELEDLLTKHTASEEQLLTIEFYKVLSKGTNGNDSLSIDLLKSIYHKAKTGKYNLISALCQYSLGKRYFIIGNNDLGYYYTDLAIQTFESLNEVNFAVITKINKGIYKAKQGKQKEALKLYYNCLNEKNRPYLQSNYYYLHLNIAETYLGLNQMDSASKYYGFFLNNLDKADIRDVYQCYNGLEQYYIKKDLMDSAYYYSKKLFQIDDSIEDILRKDLGDQFEKNYEKKRNDELLQEKDTQISSMRSSNHFILFFLIGGGILLTIIIAIVSSAYRSKNQMNKVLLEQQRSIVEKNEVIDSALKEKVILLKEIHHRVKNNLQIISSLLNLQARNVTDTEARNALEEGKERIQAIALIHQRLYQNDSFTTITMQDYIDDLVKQLSRTYLSNQQNVQITINARDVDLNLDTAIPVGLIICELVTNVMKHAFIEFEKGNIHIALNQQSHLAKGFLLTVKDDGAGMKNHDTHYNIEGLGSEIVSALTEQLEGKMETISNEKGTEIKIYFKEVED